MNSYEITSKFVLRQIAEESILVPISVNLRERDCLFVLNPVAGLIYNLIKDNLIKDNLKTDKFPLAKIKEAVLSGFTDVDESQLDDDIKGCLQQLLQVEAIIEVTDEVTRQSSDDEHETEAADPANCPGGQTDPDR